VEGWAEGKQGAQSRITSGPLIWEQKLSNKKEAGSKPPLNFHSKVAQYELV
jgi:hypothetical protein